MQLHPFFKFAKVRLLFLLWNILRKFFPIFFNAIAVLFYLFCRIAFYSHGENG